MPNQKISELTAIVTVDNSVDVLPIVDISANTTKKVTPNALKTALALDNVNNTSDANKPVSIAQQDALNAKVDENAPITPGTAPKITFDAKGLVTSGDSLDETDLPTGINANKIGTGVVSTTEFEYLNGVTSAIQTQINSKQATLVSGTNIKTINGATVLGAGDLTITGNPPSGVAGAIQFSNGSAFASDAANLFWDDTNNRLGVGTNAPTEKLQVVGSDNENMLNLTAVGGKFIVKPFLNSTYGTFLDARNNTDNSAIPITIGGSSIFLLATNNIGIGTDAPTARANIKGSGSTGATNSLLVQNINGSNLFRVRDDGNLFCEGGGALSSVGIIGTVYGLFGGASYEASASLVCGGTTQGFLPPRMTTTQKNAIASPATGLVVYDSTTNKLQCYNGSTWNDLF